MISRLVGPCALALSLWGAVAPAWAAQSEAAYPPATKRAVVRALIQKVVQLEVQYDESETEYTSGAPVQQATEGSLRALRARLTRLRPDGYRREVTQAIRSALTTRIAAQEVEAALAAADNRQKQRQAEAQLVNLRQHLASLPRTPYAEDRCLARL